MSAASAVARGRRAAESQMLDTFAAYSPQGREPDADGMEADTYRPEGEVRGKVAGRSLAGGDTQGRTVRVGDVDRLVVEGGLHVPIGAPLPVAGAQGTGWEYVLIGVGPATDPSLLGSRWLVVDAPAKSFATARRLDVVLLPAEEV